MSYQALAPLAREAERSDLARRSFDTVFALKAATSVNSISEIAGEAFSDLGLPSFAIARFFSAGATPSLKVLGGMFQPDWAERYTSQDYVSSCRIAGELLVSSRSYAWTEVLDQRTLTPEQYRIWEEARDFGLTDGLFVPTRGADGSYRAVVLAGARPPLADPLIRLSAEVLSAFYAAESSRFESSERGRDPRLSPRQIECLSWVRQGKSSTMIAEILSISVETVEEHIANACKRMGVRTRVQAVVEAVLTGILDG